MKVTRRHPLSPTEADHAWAQERVIALMHTGVPFVDAAELASRECAQRVLERETDYLERLEANRVSGHERRRQEREAEAAERRASLEARATPGMQPSLRASLGDLLAAKRRP